LLRRTTAGRKVHYPYKVHHHYMVSAALTTPENPGLQRIADRNVGLKL
jgi:hypothetical protein